MITENVLVKLVELRHVMDSAQDAISVEQCSAIYAKYVEARTMYSTGSLFEKEVGRIMLIHVLNASARNKELSNFLAANGVPYAMQDMERNDVDPDCAEPLSYLRAWSAYCNGLLSVYSVAAEAGAGGTAYMKTIVLLAQEALNTRTYAVNKDAYVYATQDLRTEPAFYAVPEPEAAPIVKLEPVTLDPQYLVGLYHNAHNSHIVCGYIPDDRIQMIRRYCAAPCPQIQGAAAVLNILFPDVEAVL